MLVYVFIIIIGLCSVALYITYPKISIKLNNKKLVLNGNNGCLILFFIPLFFISSLRDKTIGADYNNYVSTYLNIGWYHDSEIGFSFIINFCKSIFHENYVGFTIVINLIIFISLLLYLSKNKDIDKYMYIPILIFVLNPYLYLQGTFNIIRQTLATVLMMWFYYYFKKKKSVLCLLFLLLAMSIHKWSFLPACVILLSKLNWNKFWLRIVGILCFGINLFFSHGIITAFLTRIGADSLVLSGTGESAFDFPLFAVVLFIFISILISRYNSLYANESEKTDVTLYILSLELLLIFVKNDFTYRIYIMMLMILLPATAIIIKNLKGKYKSYLKVIYPAYYFAMYCLFLYSVINNSHYIPYKFVYH